VVAGEVTEGARKTTGVTPPRAKKYHPFLFPIRPDGNVGRYKKGNIRPIPPVQRFFRPGLLDFGTLALGGQLLISA